MRQRRAPRALPAPASPLARAITWAAEPGPRAWHQAELLGLRPGDLAATGLIHELSPEAVRPGRPSVGHCRFGCGTVVTIGHLGAPAIYPALCPERLLATGHWEVLTTLRDEWLTAFVPRQAAAERGLRRFIASAPGTGPHPAEHAAPERTPGDHAVHNGVRNGAVLPGDSDDDSPNTTHAGSGQVRALLRALLAALAAHAPAGPAPAGVAAVRSEAWRALVSPPFLRACVVLAVTYQSTGAAVAEHLAAVLHAYAADPVGRGVPAPETGASVAAASLHAPASPLLVPLALVEALLTSRRSSHRALGATLLPVASPSLDWWPPPAPIPTAEQPAPATAPPGAAAGFGRRAAPP